MKKNKKMTRLPTLGIKQNNNNFRIKFGQQILHIIRLNQGFCYLVVIMDIFSRKILNYKISNSLDAQFCIDALNEALAKYPTPEIFNTEQGSQFTSENFCKILIDKDIKISMNSTGRALDNIFVERFFLER